MKKCKIIKSEIKYQNPWMSVREDKIIEPNGCEAIFGVVSMGGGSTVLPIDDEGNVYLIKEFRYAMGREIIEAVSGGNEIGESYKETARRELEEEAGIIAKKIIPMGHINPFTSVVDSSNYMFLARDLEFKKPNPEAGEIIKTIKMPYKKALKLVANGTITHGASVVLILKAKDKL